jgi:hypothetical protein
MTPAITIRMSEHRQTGSTVLHGQGRQNRPGCIAETVEAPVHNRSTGLVSFHECHKQVSLDGPSACSGSQLSERVVRPIGGGE